MRRAGWIMQVTGTPGAGRLSTVAERHKWDTLRGPFGRFSEVVDGREVVVAMPGRDGEFEAVVNRLE